MGPMPDWPSTRLLQVSPTVCPSGVMAPRPVMTTRSLISTPKGTSGADESLAAPYGLPYELAGAVDVQLFDPVARPTQPARKPAREADAEVLRFGIDNHGIDVHLAQLTGH